MARKQGLGRQGIPDKNYHQHNYIDVIKSLTPDLYHDTDYAIYGTKEDILYSVLGKILKVSDSISGIFPTANFDTSTLQHRFILRNELTNIRPYIFENKILKPLGVSFSDFTSENEFKLYVSSTLLPNIVLNSPSSKFIDGVNTLVTSSVTNSAETHAYLLDTLSWYYVLNSAGIAGTSTNPSATVTDEFVKLWQGESLKEKDSVTSVFRYIWDNRQTVSLFKDCIPIQFGKTDFQISAGTHTSGTQNRDKMETLLKIWYNPHDENSETVDTYLSVFTSLGTFSPKMVEDGAFTKFLQAISYGFYDINTTIEDLGDLVDIERCPPEFLQHLASLIGWKLMTGDIDRWRAQLRKAVYIYKGKGTRKALEEALELVFSDPNIIPTDQILETWEMFLPRMIYYLIATESQVLNNSQFGPGVFRGIPTERYSTGNLDLNYRAATDYVLEILHKNTPPSPTREKGGCIYFNDVKFDLSSWDPENKKFPGFYHRQTPNCPVPPWENDRFYDNTYISKAQIDILNDILTADVNSSAVNSPRGGLEIPLEYVANLSSILMKEDAPNVGDPSLYHMLWNRKWKFYASGYNPPMNLSSIAASKDVTKLGLLDYWISKSSVLTSQVYLTDLDYSVEAAKIANAEIIHNIRQVFKSFLPFHVISKLFSTIKYEESHTSKDKKLCVIGLVNWFDLSPTGDFDHYILNNLVPSSVTVSSLGNSLPDASANFAIVSHADTPRASGRRRSLKYLNTLLTYNRSGKAMPVPKKSIFQYSTSAYNGLDMHTSEFIPLGYNFSSGSYFSPSGSFGRVYDASNDIAVSSLDVVFSGTVAYPGTEVYLQSGRANLVDTSAVFEGVAVSSTFPCRIPFLHECVPTVSRSEIKGIKRVIIDSLCRQGLTKDFGTLSLDNFKFGTGLSRDFANVSGVLSSSIFSGVLGVPASANDGISFPEKDLKIIYSHFNSMVSSNATRVATTGSAQALLMGEVFGVSGGSRAYYVDPLGSKYPLQFGLETSGEPYLGLAETHTASGVLFNLSDN
tara:strand:- start:7513 stop:10581 length:3069 start_codon:yes stop_codon:yes gene_type:complete